MGPDLHSQRALKSFIAVGLAAFAMVLSLLFFGQGCRPGESPDPNAAIYGIELQFCAEHAKTWSEYDLCKDSVKARWGRLDGGTDG